jgi:glycerophosphoryl diester phosphodiesterase
MTDSHVHESADKPILVAHRGYAARYPENSLQGCEAALRLGCRYIEIDIQLTADGVPVLLHDLTLSRTADRDICITDIDSGTLASYDIADRQRLGGDVPFTALPTLAAYVNLLRQWPTARTFVEIKEESLAHFGHDFVSERILTVLEPIIDRCIAISYDIKVIRQIQALDICQTGWVLKHYDTVHHELAQQLGPDYLICNYQKLADSRLWPGNWQWMLYEVTDATLAVDLFRRGSTLIETMAIGDLLKDLDTVTGTTPGHG